MWRILSAAALDPRTIEGVFSCGTGHEAAGSYRISIVLPVCRNTCRVAAMFTEYICGSELEQNGAETQLGVRKGLDFEYGAIVILRQDRLFLSLMYQRNYDHAQIPH